MLDSAPMANNLVIVESPAKAKTIERYLGPDFAVLASYGHVRDLPERPGKNDLGVDVEHDFQPHYEVVASRRKQVDAIARAARKAGTVYLATDLDREGEAIAWHIVEAAGLPHDKTRRVTFSEITEQAIREAFAHPRDINHDLVDAQQARRIVDRLVGYTLSPLLWKKIRAGLSAGRVQSVAVRLVVEREREIRAFAPVEYWTLEAILRAPSGELFQAEVIRIDGAKLSIGDESAALAHTEELRGLNPAVRSVAVKRSSRNPAPPFTTSTLQQEASRKLGFSPKRTMSVAQRLYEGVETAEGQVGLITYMRTDSVALSSGAVAEARDVIDGRYGGDYLPDRPRAYRTTSRNAQEAHEAIRPTSFARDPETLASSLERDEARLYRLIWQRAIASQMAAKVLETTTVDLVAGRYELRASASRTVFPGFTRVYTEGRDDETEESERTLPALAEGDEASVDAITPEQHFTEPPPRYTEATLVKALEERGIGRPSTYAATVSTIIDRGYVAVRERKLVPEPLGEIVTDMLVANFATFVDPDFTARMESDLDDVAEGRRDWVPVVRAFYGPFRDAVDTTDKAVRPAAIGLATTEVCSEGHPMVIRAGRFGEYLACSMYPDHKETRPLSTSAGGSPSGDGSGAGEQEGGSAVAGVGETCPKCGATDEGVLVARRGRFGAFAGCSRYPACDYIHRTGPPPPEQLPFTITCLSCKKGHLVARRARRTGSVFYGCSRYPTCRYTTSLEPTGALHDADDGPVGRRADGTALCLACGAPVELPAAGALGVRLAGGPPDPGALKSGRQGARSGSRASGGRGARGTRSRTSTARSGGSRSSRRARTAGPADPDGGSGGDDPET